MTRPVPNDHPLGFADRYTHLREQGRRRGHRYLVFVSGTESWCEAQLLRLPGALDDCLLVASRALCGLAPSQTAKALGSEFSSLIINAHSHQKLNEWLAAAGCLTAGGVLILLCPEFSVWPAYFGGQSGLATKTPSVFIQRLLNVAPALDGVWRWDQEKGASGAVASVAKEWHQTLPTADQQAALSAIKLVVSGRAKRPLVIRSDRGRGKTSVLGLAVAELFREYADGSGTCRRVLITAPSFSAVKGAFERLAAALPKAQWKAERCEFESCYLRYLPFDAALQSREQWDLVLVDEAAALPVAGLRALLLRYPRIVFSSTVHGYEGSGRGFDIRFKEILAAERPHWRRVGLNEPIRWSVTDPLERALNTLFLLNAEPLSSDVAEDVRIRVVTRTELGNDDFLRQIFGLLVQAHYQTTPQDLQYLLDGEAVLVIASAGESVLGVCQLLPEGGFSADLAADVVKAQRRPKGHLVAQRLAHRSGDETYLTLPSLRVNRIAVVAGLRRNGIGSAMLKVAENYARSEHFAYISSSFAADAQLIEFWRAENFLPVYLGSRRDSASGLYSLIVVKSFNSALETSYLAQQLNDDLALSLVSVYRNISPDLLISLLAASGSENRNVTELVIVAVRRYCSGELIFEQAAASMARLCLSCDLRGIHGAELATELLLLGRDWADLAEQFELSGRAEIEKSLKLFFQNLISIRV